MHSDDEQDHAPHELEGAGQGGGSGGTVGNEAAISPGSEPGPTPDDWDAKLADDEFYPERDAPDERGSAGEDVGRTQDIPGT